MRFDHHFFSAAVLIAGLGVVIIPAAHAANPKLAGQTIASDQDKNGKPDHWETYDSRGVKVLVASDTNNDGKPDYWKHPIRGMMLLREKDRNHDGAVDDRQVTDFIYDKTLKFNRHLYVTREADENYDGKIDLYRVRGERKPVPDKTGQLMDAAPWSVEKDAAERNGTTTKRARQSGADKVEELVRQMNARQDMGRS